VQPWTDTPGLLIGNPPYGARAQFRNVRTGEHNSRGPEGFRRAEAELQDEGESLLDDFGPGASPDGATADAFWTDFAANLKRHFAGWRVALISSDLDLPKRMRLKPSRKVVLFNGALECRLFIFEIVAGSNRD
jgi:putative N6-adenine-specific DNA methylase